MFTSGCNIYRSSRVTALIPRNLQVPKDKSTGPTGPEHEALESLRFQRRIIRDYEFLHDIILQPISNHGAHKQEISLITAMRIPDQEFLLQSGATDHLQQISIDTSDLHQPNLRVLPFIDMQGKDPESS
ncbi:hypothetical protein Bca4012_089468 [Brassica carinata]|uniref:Uncharacterized protein n=1 Tax=Brassica carinata TaxID=52824 RepID=A0A8X7PAX5_BRACI|nr:hypothetical protein Bca52824_087011 [Brassica carinata]